MKAGPRHSSGAALALGLLLCCLGMTASGCWNRREINEMAIVVTCALGKDPLGVEVTAELPLVKPTTGAGGGGGGQGGPGQGAGWAVSNRGRTPFEAIRGFIRFSGRKLYFGHTVAIIVGEDAAREDQGRRHHGPMPRMRR